MTQNRQKLPRSLELAQICFSNYRETRSKRSLPTNLWDLAVEQALAFGCNLAAKTLGLNPQRLQQRVDLTQNQLPLKTAPIPSPTAPKFISINPMPPTSKTTESAVEIHSQNGCSLKITWSGNKAPFDLPLLAEKLLRTEI